MMNNSLGRILFLLKGDWMINRKQHGLVAVIFLIVIWFIELVPLAFSRSFTEWEKAISSMDPSFIHFTIARVLYLFVFLSWVSNTLYHSRIQHFYLVPLSSLEKYILILLQGVVMFILAAVVAYPLPCHILSGYTYGSDPHKPIPRRRYKYHSGYLATCPFYISCICTYCGAFFLQDPYTKSSNCHTLCECRLYPYLLDVAPPARRDFHRKLHYKGSLRECYTLYPCLSSVLIGRYCYVYWGVLYL